MRFISLAKQVQVRWCQEHLCKLTDIYRSKVCILKTSQKELRIASECLGRSANIKVYIFIVIDREKRQKNGKDECEKRMEEKLCACSVCFWMCSIHVCCVFVKKERDRNIREKKE